MRLLAFFCIIAALLSTSANAFLFSFKKHQQLNSINSNNSASAPLPPVVTATLQLFKAYSALNATMAAALFAPDAEFISYNRQSIVRLKGREQIEEFLMQKVFNPASAITVQPPQYDTVNDQRALFMYEQAAVFANPDADGNWGVSTPCFSVCNINNQNNNLFITRFEEHIGPSAFDQQQQTNASAMMDFMSKQFIQQYLYRKPNISWLSEAMSPNFTQFLCQNGQSEVTNKTVTLEQLSQTLMLWTGTTTTKIFASGDAVFMQGITVGKAPKDTALATTCTESWTIEATLALPVGDEKSSLPFVVTDFLVVANTDIAKKKKGQHHFLQNI